MMRVEETFMAEEHQFLVGTVVGFQGLGGEVKVRTSTNSPDLLLDIRTVRVGQQILKVRNARIDKRMLLLSFTEFPDRTSVEHLEDAKLYCKESELLPLEEEEFWVSDLVGIEVFTTGGTKVGKVVSVVSTGSDILEVQPEGATDGKTILVPFVKDIVPTVDMKGKRIEVVDIPGLLEPQ